MRLGEIRNTLREVLSDDDRISIDHEPLFGGQAYLVKNYSLLISALDFLAKQSWNDANYEEIKAIKKEYGDKTESVQLPQDKFNQLNSYVSALNAKLPLYVSVIEAMVEDQDEHAINIKLSESITDINGLTEANNRLNKILDLYNVDGQFEFKDFDKGTNWYEIVAVGVLSYRFFIAGLNIAQKYFDIRKSYFDSEKAKLDLQAALNKTDISKTDLEAYKKRRMEGLVKDEVKKAIKNIGIGTNNKNELTVKVIKATTKLIQELDEEDTEFHLSLNPPNYVNEHMGSLVIDYSKLPKAKKSIKKTKQIGAPRISKTKRKK